MKIYSPENLREKMEAILLTPTHSSAVPVINVVALTLIEILDTLESIDHNLSNPGD